MQLIKLDATDSTNDYLKRLIESQDMADFYGSCCPTTV